MLTLSSYACVIYASASGGAINKNDAAAIEQGCYFDQSKADHVKDFIHKFCRQSKGKWAGKPLTLLPWQEAFIDRLYGWRRDDHTRRYRSAGVWVPKKNGKALAIDTRIPTPKGWRTMGDLRVGDTVYAETGKPCTVVAGTDVMHGRPCYRVTFADGSQVVADADHQWIVYPTYSNREKRTKTTQELTESLQTATGYNYTVLASGAVEKPAADLPIDPYTLGVWLGDGHSASARITIADKDAEIAEYIRSAGVKVEERTKHDNCTTYAIGRTGKGRIDSIQSELRRLDILNDKHIPDCYLNASIEQRTALLQGLLDTDGYISPSSRVELITKFPKLRDDTLELARSLGIIPTSTSKRAKIYGKDCGDVWRVCFQGYKHTNCFRLKRKAGLLKDCQGGFNSALARAVVDVEPVPSVPVKCIQVDSPSHCYLCGDYIPTHNSTLLSALSLYSLLADQEPGAEVYVIACDVQQANIVFGESANMIEQNPTLSKHLEVLRSQKKINHKASTSIYRVLSSDKASKHGYNTHCVIWDELAAQKDSELWDIMRYSTAGRQQPLTISISTAGFARNSIGWENFKYAEQVLTDQVIDTTFLPVIYQASPDKAFDDPAAWEEANPSLGVTINKEELADAAKEAKSEPRKQAAFETLRLNRWVGHSDQFLDMHAWNECGEDFTEDDLLGMDCIGGADLSRKHDLTAVVYVFEKDNLYYLLPRFWSPAEAADQKQRHENVPYLHWSKEGYITLTPGEVIDYRYIRKQINEDSKKFRIKEIGYDTRDAELLFNQQLRQEDGIDTVEIPPTWRNLAPPTAHFDRLVRQRKIRHNNNPILTWNAGNTVAKTNPQLEVMLDKVKAVNRIDGISAAILAFARIMQPEEENIYESRGVITF